MTLNFTKLASGLYPALLAQSCTDDGSWYDSGSSDSSSSSSAEQTEITLDERTDIWTDNN